MDSNMTEETVFVRKTLVDQVAESLRESNMNGDFSEISNFPPSRLLARRYGVSHNIMLKVLQQLQDEDLIYLNSKRQGYMLRP